MSGGSYNYAYQQIENLAATMQKTTPLRKAFAKHLLLVAKAAHDIEWVDSNDCGPGDEDEAIRAVIGQNSDKEELSIVVDEAKQIEKTLRSILQRIAWDESL